jgi:hypothetical protein
MFQVLENGKPADSTSFPMLKKGKGWDKSIFDTFEDANDYAKQYFYPYLIGDFELNKVYSFAGGEDTAQIIEV